MSGRRIPVDLGPLSLNVLEDGRPYTSAPSASIDDVLRLKAVMHGSTESPHHFVQDHVAADDYGDIQANVASGRALRVAAPGGQALNAPDEAHVALLAFEMSAALQTLSGLPAGDSSELRLVLRPMVLRDAELGVADSRGQLEFSLWVGDADDSQWLALQLPRLVATLGERLRRRLRVRVFEGMRTSRLLAEQAWPSEGDA